MNRVDRNFVPNVLHSFPQLIQVLQCCFICLELSFQVQPKVLDRVEVCGARWPLKKSDVVLFEKVDVLRVIWSTFLVARSGPGALVRWRIIVSVAFV